MVTGKVPAGHVHADKGRDLDSHLGSARDRHTERACDEQRERTDQHTYGRCLPFVTPEHLDRGLSTQRTSAFLARFRHT